MVKRIWRPSKWSDNYGRVIYTDVTQISSLDNIIKH